MYIQAELSLILLIILESMIYDEGLLSKVWKELIPRDDFVQGGLSQIHHLHLFNLSV